MSALKPTLMDAIKLAHLLEPLCIERCAHCALAGSTLHLGYSYKDIDIIVYPHTVKEWNISYTIEHLKKVIPDLTEVKSSYIDKQLFQGTWNNFNVDIILLTSTL